MKGNINGAYQLPSILASVRVTLETVPICTSRLHAKVPSCVSSTLRRKCDSPGHTPAFRCALGAMVVASSNDRLSSKNRHIVLLAPRQEHAGVLPLVKPSRATLAAGAVLTIGPRARQWALVGASREVCPNCAGSSGLHSYSLIKGCPPSSVLRVLARALLLRRFYRSDRGCRLWDRRPPAPKAVGRCRAPSSPGSAGGRWARLARQRRVEHPELGAYLVGGSQRGEWCVRINVQAVTRDHPQPASPRIGPAASPSTASYGYTFHPSSVADS
jgi:hypothetical protein